MRDAYREMALFENNGLTMGEQYDAIQNLIPRSIQNFAICGCWGRVVVGVWWVVGGRGWLL